MRIRQFWFYSLLSVLQLLVLATLNDLRYRVAPSSQVGSVDVRLVLERIKSRLRLLDRDSAFLGRVIETLASRDRLLERSALFQVLPDKAALRGFGNVESYVVSAEGSLRLGRSTTARAFIDSAIVATDKEHAVSALRQARAIALLYDRRVREALGELAILALEHEATGRPALAAETQAQMAIISAGVRDSVRASNHVEEARRLRFHSDNIAVLEILVGFLDGTQSYLRRYLDEATQVLIPLPWDMRKAGEEMHQLTGLVLVAERKPEEALEHLRKGGDNAITQLAIVEAYLQLGRTDQADSVRAARFGLENATLGSTIFPLARYRHGRR